MPQCRFLLGDYITRKGRRINPFLSRKIYKFERVVTQGQTIVITPLGAPHAAFVAFHQEYRKASKKEVAEAIARFITDGS